MEPQIIRTLHAVQRISAIAVFIFSKNFQFAHLRSCRSRRNDPSLSASSSTVRRTVWGTPCKTERWIQGSAHLTLRVSEWKPTA